MNKELKIVSSEGILVTDSRDVAAMIKKRHDNLLKSINNYVAILTASKMSALNFFIPHQYTDDKNEIRKCYLLTKKGCDMVANKMTGEKGILFTAAYVSKFEEMERTLKGLSKPSYMIEDEVQRAKRWIEEREQLAVLENENVLLIEENIDLKDGEDGIISPSVCAKYLKISKGNPALLHTILNVMGYGDYECLRGNKNKGFYANEKLINVLAKNGYVITRPLDSQNRSEVKFKKELVDFLIENHEEEIRELDKKIWPQMHKKIEEAKAKHRKKY